MRQKILIYSYIHYIAVFLSACLCGICKAFLMLTLMKYSTFRVCSRCCNFFFFGWVWSVKWLFIVVFSVFRYPYSINLQLSDIYIYICMKYTALSIFLSKWSAGTNSSMLNISSWSLCILSFTIIFITFFIIPLNTEKAPYKPDFSDSLNHPA